MESLNTHIKLASEDGQVVECLFEAMTSSSGFLRDMFESQACPSDVVQLSDLGISHFSLTKICEYSKYAHSHRPPHIEKPIYHHTLFDITSPWYAKFALNLSDEQLAELIVAASKMDTKELLDLLSACLALKLKSMTVEQIREYFNV